MPIAKTQIAPGIVSQLTQTDAEGRWWNGNLARFRDMRAEKRGGWLAATINLFEGMCRGLRSWTDLSQNQDLGVGTNTRFYLYQGGSFYDITPLDASGTLGANPFATTNGSAIVTVTSVGHLRAVGDIVIFAGAATFNNVTILGEYTVLAVIDSDHFSITAATVANATGSGGGAAVTYQYLLGVGYADSTPLFGWGGGGWGLGTWGTPRTVPATTHMPRTWSIDNWGEECIANPLSLGIYRWRPVDGVTSRATRITNSPIYSNAALVSLPIRQLASLGSETGSVQDPLLVRWSDVEDYTVWAPLATNQAGSFRLSSGNFIVGGARTSKQILIWTDRGLWTMTYIGLPYVYSFINVGTDCGAISPNAMVCRGDSAYWMGQGAFFVYSPSTVRVIPCPVFRSVFQNFNTQQAYKVFGRVNHLFNEIIWYFCSQAATECDSYVAYNYLIGASDPDKAWDFGIGTMQRTAGIDNDVFSSPLVTDSNGKLYYDELGYDADTAPLGDFLESGYFDIAEGDEFLFLDKIIPDLFIAGTAQITVFVRSEPNGPVVTKGPYQITSSTRMVPLRARGRQAAIRMESIGLGSYWRLGAMRYRVAPDGKR